MVVSVQFNGTQRALTRTKEIDVQLVNNGRVSDVLVHIKNCYPDLHLNEEGVLVTVNNKVASIDSVLNPHDRVAFLPHLGGG